MAAVKIRDIPYLADGSAYYRAIRELPQAIWLDSGRPHAQFGRYDILSAQPRVVLLNTGSHTLIRTANSDSSSSASPFDLLTMALAEMAVDADRALPFCGGAMGYFGYNLRQHLEPSPFDTSRDIALPDMGIGLYEWAIIQDHRERRSCLVSLPDCPTARLADLIQRANSTAKSQHNTSKNNNNFYFQISELKSNFNVNTYREKVACIQAYIQAGDCYQVNFAQRFSSQFEGDPFFAYCHLRRLLPAPYAAFMEVAGGAVLSHSPEQFLKVISGKVETRPIKGTAPRHPDPDRDQANAEWLYMSTKDRAENLMIVDLLRNDLGKSCRFGSVCTPKLFALESYTNVHHLVSTVRGQLRPECSVVDLLKGCFPGGSITGAPKIRAMEIIAELENCDRSVYCGSIGYLSAHGNMDTNIAIRSLVCSGGRIYCWGGGGIVADSDADAEYAESLAKVKILLDGLTTASS
jgi:para-aminobenzoate synthetase component I